MIDDIAQGLLILFLVIFGPPTLGLLVAQDKHDFGECFSQGWVLILFLGALFGISLFIGRMIP